MIEVKDYEIITIKNGQSIIITSNDGSVLSSHNEKTVSGVRYEDDLLIYDKSGSKPVSIALYKDFNFDKIERLTEISIGEFSEAGEVIAAVLVKLQKGKALKPDMAASGA